MNIRDLVRKTKIYIAAEWDGDHDAVEKLHQWNESDHWSLHFKDVHEYTQSYDSSLYCSIKRSLATRMSISKTFILIVGENTNSTTKGKCCYCGNYEKFGTYGPYCKSGNSPFNNESYIEYECKKALEEGCKIVVLYNDTKVNRSKCPEAVRWKGEHVAMRKLGYNGFVIYKDWDYQSVKKAIDG